MGFPSKNTGYTPARIKGLLSGQRADEIPLDLPDVSAVVIVDPPYRANLLPVAAASAPLPITIPWNAEFYEDDTVQLLWDGVPVGTPHRITRAQEDAQAPFTVSLELDVNDDNDWGPNRPHRLAYQVYWFVADITQDSGAIDLYVDRTAPGGDLLGELEIPGVVGPNFVVLPEHLDAMGNLVARVPSYLGRFEGDSLLPLMSKDGITWLELTGSVIKLPAGATGNEPVEIFFPRAELESNGDGIWLLGYRVTDRAGNVSIEAAGRPVTLLLVDVPTDPDLFPPHIPLFADGVINEEDARALTVEIPTFDNGKNGDYIELYWQNVQVGALTITDDTLDPILTFDVSYTNIVAGGGTESYYLAEVYYTVRRLGSLVATSPVLEDVLVDLRLPGGPDPDPETPEHGNLLNAWIIGDGGGPRNVITADQFGKDAIITLPWPVSATDPTVTFLEGDLIDLVYGTHAFARYRVTSADATNKVDLPFTLLGSDMTTVGSGSIPLSYSVTRRVPAAGSLPGYDNTVFSDIQPVLVIGASEIPGGGNPLAKGEFVRLNVNGALNIVNTRGGAPYRIFLNYDNVASGDHIYLTFEGFNRRGDTALPGTLRELDQIINNIDIGQGIYVFTIPEEVFDYTLYFPGGVNLVKVFYRIVNAAGTGNSLISETLIDLRGGQPASNASSNTLNDTGISTASASAPLAVAFSGAVTRPRKRKPVILTELQQRDVKRLAEFRANLGLTK